MDMRKWFKEAQYGMMVHWGLYSLLGGEWRGKKAAVMRNGFRPVTVFREWNMISLQRHLIRYILMRTNGFVLQKNAE